MDEMRVKLNILCDILKEKRAALGQIADICENEQYVYQQPYTKEKIMMLKGMSVEKQALVDQVLRFDAVFQNAFDAMKEEFETASARYPDEIRALQSLIKEVMALDVKIRSVENETKIWIDAEIKRAQTAKKQTTTAAKNHLLKQYEKNNNKAAR